MKLLQMWMIDAGLPYTLRMLMEPWNRFLEAPSSVLVDREQIVSRPFEGRDGNSTPRMSFPRAS